MRLVRPAALFVLLTPFTVLAQDCSANAASSIDVQVNCAIQHAGFLYAQRCGASSYCSSQDPQLLAAYASASRLYDRSHSIRGKANDAYYSAFLQERAHSFSGASAEYLTCITLAKSEGTIRLGQNCATRLAVVHCAVDPALPSCQRSGSQIVTISSGGGSAASVLSADGSTENDADKPISIPITLPAAEDIATLSQAMTAQQKQSAGAVLRSRQIQVQPNEHRPN